MESHKEQNRKAFLEVMRRVWNAIVELGQVSKQHSYGYNLNWVESVEKECWQKEKELEKWFDETIEEWNVDGEQLPIAMCVCVNNYREWASKDCESLTVNLVGHQNTEAICYECQAKKDLHEEAIRKEEVESHE